MGIQTPTDLGWVSHPLLYGNNGSLDPGTYTLCISLGKLLYFKKNLIFSPPFWGQNPLTFHHHLGYGPVDLEMDHWHWIFGWESFVPAAPDGMFLPKKPQGFKVDGETTLDGFFNLPKPPPFRWCRAVSMGGFLMGREKKKHFPNHQPTKLNPDVQKEGHQPVLTNIKAFPNAPSHDHQTFQVPKMEVLSLIRLFWGWVFPYISRIHTA